MKTDGIVSWRSKYLKLQSNDPFNSCPSSIPPEFLFLIYDELWFKLTEIKLLKSDRHIHTHTQRFILRRWNPYKQIYLWLSGYFKPIILTNFVSIVMCRFQWIN